VFMYGIQGVCVRVCVDALLYLAFVLLCQDLNKQVFNYIALFMPISLS